MPRKGGRARGGLLAYRPCAAAEAHRPHLKHNLNALFSNLFLDYSYHHGDGRGDDVKD